MYIQLAMMESSLGN